MVIGVGDRFEVITVTDNNGYCDLYEVGSTGIITRSCGKNKIIAFLGKKSTFYGCIVEPGCYKRIGQLKVTRTKSPIQRHEFREKYNLKYL